MTLQARYSTPCSVCDETIQPGDLMRIETPSSGWQHVVCPDPLPEVKRRVCNQCFTEVSVAGTCLCDDPGRAVMTRLAAEYSAADHHDLARIDSAVSSPPVPGCPDEHVAVCACGEALPIEPTRADAFAAWDLHREQAVFG